MRMHLAGCTTLSVHEAFFSDASTAICRPLKPHGGITVPVAHISDVLQAARVKRSRSGELRSSAPHLPGQSRQVPGDYWHRFCRIGETGGRSYAE